MFTPRLTATALGLAAAIGLSASPALAGSPIIGFPPFGITVSGCGEVVFDEVCTQLFKFDDGGYYVFSGLSDYALGDRFFVEGSVCLICLLTPCGTPYSAMLDATVSDCKPKVPPTIPFAACVTVALHIECGVLALTDDGNFLYVGELFQPDQYGLQFFVEGGMLADAMWLCLGSPFGESFPVVTGATLSGCTGDLNVDGVVDGFDLANLLAAWGPCTQDHIDCPGDLDGNHVVNGIDLAMLLGEWTLPRS